MIRKTQKKRVYNNGIPKIQLPKATLEQIQHLPPIYEERIERLENAKKGPFGLLTSQHAELLNYKNRLRDIYARIEELKADVKDQRITA